MILFGRARFGYSGAMKTLNRYSPLQFPRGRTLKNRVVVPPMASATADARGFVTIETLRHYEKLAASEAGLLFAEYSFVHRSGRSEENQLGVCSDAHLPGLTQLASVMRGRGALAGLQLVHAGGKTSRDLSDGALMGPSAVSVPVKGDALEPPDPMSESEIDLWVESFAAAAGRVARAGFDIVELHAAHGYGLNQWLSPLTNRREDAYGGDLTNRARLLFRIVTRIERDCPSLLISVRMPGQDFLPGGLSTSDMQWVARELENLGVDILNISSGVGGWRRPEPRIGEGYLVSEAQAIQSVVAIPVIGVGGIESGAFIDQALREGRFSLAAVGRAILNEPSAWGRRVLSSSSDVGGRGRDR